MIILNKKTPELSAFLKELHAILDKHEATILSNGNGDLAVSMQVISDFHDFEFPSELNTNTIAMDYFGSQENLDWS